MSTRAQISACLSLIRPEWERPALTEAVLAYVGTLAPTGLDRVVDDRSEGARAVPAQVRWRSKNLTVRSIAAVKAGPNACPSSYHCSCESTPARCRAWWVAVAQPGGQTASVRELLERRTG